MALLLNRAKNEVQMNPHRHKPLFFAAFFIANVFIGAFFLNIRETWNGASRAAMVLALIEERTLMIDRYHQATGDKALIGGHYYSDKAPLTALVVAPVYGAYRWFKGWSPLPDSSLLEIAILIGSFMVSTVPFALMMMLTLQHLIEHKKIAATETPVWLVLGAYYGSFLYVFASTFFGHLFAGLFIVLSYQELTEKHRYLMSGFFLSLAIASEYTLAVAAPIWLLYIWRHAKNRGPFLSFIGGLTPGMLVLLTYNFAVTGEIGKMIYSFPAEEQFAVLKSSLGFSLPNPAVVWKLLFSPSRGLAIYAPFLVGIAVSLWQKREPKFWLRFALHPAVGFAVVLFLVVSSFAMWDGGRSYGPRYLTAAVLLALYAGISETTNNKISQYLTYALMFFGSLCTLLASVTRGYYFDNSFQNPLIKPLLSDLINGHLNFVALPELAGVPPTWCIPLWFLSLAGIGILFSKWYKSFPNAFLTHGVQEFV